MLGLHVQQFRLVVVYQYEDRIVEIPQHPTSLALAMWQLEQNDKRNEGSVHVLSARVYSDQDYRRHMMRRVAEFALVSE